VRVPVIESLPQNCITKLQNILQVSGFLPSSSAGDQGRCFTVAPILRPSPESHSIGALLRPRDGQCIERDLELFYHDVPTTSTSLQRHQGQPLPSPQRVFGKLYVESVWEQLSKRQKTALRVPNTRDTSDIPGLEIIHTPGGVFVATPAWRP
jgi:hypothetical protein